MPPPQVALTILHMHQTHIHMHITHITHITHTHAHMLTSESCGKMLDFLVGLETQERILVLGED